MRLTACLRSKLQFRLATSTQGAEASCRLLTVRPVVGDELGRLGHCQAQPAHVVVVRKLPACAGSAEEESQRKHNTHVIMTPWCGPWCGQVFTAWVWLCTALTLAQGQVKKGNDSSSTVRTELRCNGCFAQTAVTAQSRCSIGLVHCCVATHKQPLQLPYALCDSVAEFGTLAVQAINGRINLTP